LNRFFIDECLSASLVAIAKERGLLVDYGPHLGMAGWQDWNIARFAFENGYIVVTNNRRDFLREYLKHEIHYGLIVLVPNSERQAQIALFSIALDRLAEMDEPPEGKLVEILADGSLHIRDWTSRDHDIAHISNPPWFSR
jgi:predicted nuclease of predicted toxin-antitoxin system